MGYVDCEILMPDATGEYLEVKAGIGIAESTLGLRIPQGQGISWWVMVNGMPQNIPDVSEDERYFPGAEGIGSELYIPLEVRGRRLGVLVVQCAEKGAFRPNDMRMLMAVAGHLASALEVAQLHEQVKKSADTDALTGLYNRRVFFQSLEACIKRAYSGEPGKALSVVIFDVDDLKSVNDRYGHLAGDAVLSRIADHLRSGFRYCDIVARYGGDEFVALLPEASKDAATRRARAIVDSWAAETVESPGGQTVDMPGASFGVASYPFDGDQARVILSVADDLLREAKQSKSRG
jgi:diguanylate cyclase (GGDEF)-like protein